MASLTDVAHNVSEIDIWGSRPQNDAVSEEILYVQLGRLLRQRRRERGLTQEQVGKSLDLTRTSITNIEQGRQGMSVATLVAIARVLEAEPQQLLADAVRGAELASQLPASVPPEVAEAPMPEQLREWVMAIRDEGDEVVSNADAVVPTTVGRSK